MSQDVHAAWAELLADSYRAAVEVARDVVPTPIVVGIPSDPLDDSSELEDKELVVEGLQGWAWVEVDAKADGDAAHFVGWLSGNIETEHPPSVPVHSYEDDGREVVRVDIQGVSDSVEPNKAAADALANALNQFVPGLVATPVTRLN